MSNQMKGFGCEGALTNVFNRMLGYKKATYLLLLYKLICDQPIIR